MTDGHIYDVPHPELLMVGRSNAVIGLRPDPQTGVVDRTDYFALLHIVRVEDLPPVASMGTTTNAPT